MTTAEAMRRAGTRPLPAEDIFGNTKKLTFIMDAVADYRGRASGEVSILDFGCGNAINVGSYLIGDGVRYLGVDFHAPSLDYARAHFGGPGAEFLDAVPKDRSFDIIIFADVLEHVHDPLGLLRVYLPQLKPGGIVIGSVPNGYGPCETEKLIDQRLHLYAALRFVKRGVQKLLGGTPSQTLSVPYNSACGHVIWFTMPALRRLINNAGLKIVRFQHAGFVGADLTGSTIFARPGFIALNVRVSDHLPSWAVSAWFFVMVRDEAGEGVKRA